MSNFERINQFDDAARCLGELGDFQGQAGRVFFVNAQWSVPDGRLASVVWYTERVSLPLLSDLLRAGATVRPNLDHRWKVWELSGVSSMSELVEQRRTVQFPACSSTWAPVRTGWAPRR